MSSTSSFSNIKITKYFNYEPRFNIIFSSDNLRRIKDGAYVTNFDAKQSQGTHWFSLFIERNTTVYFGSFGNENITQEVLNKIKNKFLTHYIFTIQSDDSNLCRFRCIAFIEYTIAGKCLSDHTN